MQNTFHIPHNSQRQIGLVLKVVKAPPCWEWETCCWFAGIHVAGYRSKYWMIYGSTVVDDYILTAIYHLCRAEKRLPGVEVEPSWRVGCVNWTKGGEEAVFYIDPLIGAHLLQHPPLLPPALISGRDVKNTWTIWHRTIWHQDNLAPEQFDILQLAYISQLSTEYIQ